MYQYDTMEIIPSCRILIFPHHYTNDQVLTLAYIMKPETKEMLHKKLIAALSKETPKSLRDWLKKKRKKRANL
jgi:hypothetical protein